MRSREGVSYQPCLIVFMAALLLFYGLKSLSFTQYIEFYYLESAREMIELKQWLVPSFNYSYRFDKPILFYWMVVIFFKTLGTNMASARLISAIFGAGTVYLTYRIAERRGGEIAGWLASAIVISTPHFILNTRAATTDMMLTFFITSSLFAYFSFLEGKGRGWFFILYPSLALATLTKGPIGFIIPVLVIFVHLGLERNREGLVALKPFKGALFYLAIILPWSLAIIKRYGLKAMLSIIHAQDAVGADPIHEPFYYYFQHIFGELFPWGPLLIIFLLFMIIRRDLFKGRIKRDLFPLLWFFVPILFLSIFDKKIARYMVPIVPPMAIYLAGIMEEGRGEISAVFRGYSTMLVLLFLSFSGATGYMVFIVSQYDFSFGPSLYFLPVIFLAGGLLMLFLIFKKRDKDIPLAFAVTIISSFLIIGVHVMPKIDSRPLMDFGRLINAELSPEASVAVYNEHPNDLIFFAARRVEEISSLEQLKEFAEGRGERFSVIYEKDFESLPDQLKKSLSIVYKRHRWLDVENLSELERFLENPEGFKSWVYLVKIGGGAGN